MGSTFRVLIRLKSSSCRAALNSCTRFSLESNLSKEKMRLSILDSLIFWFRWNVSFFIILRMCNAKIGNGSLIAYAIGWAMVAVDSFFAWRARMMAHSWRVGSRFLLAVLVETPKGVHCVMTGRECCSIIGKFPEFLMGGVLFLQINQIIPDFSDWIVICFHLYWDR